MKIKPTVESTLDQFRASIRVLTKLDAPAHDYYHVIGEATAKLMAHGYTEQETRVVLQRLHAEEQS